MKLENKKVLILSGPTHEYFDPVRFIGNASSGKMGKALAEEALARGMDIEFISGPVPDANLPNVDAVSPPHSALEKDAEGTPRLHLERITSADEMLTAAREKFADADLIIFAAAVADFQPLEKSDEKWSTCRGEASGRSREVGTNLTIELRPTPDIAATLCANKRPDQTAIGFALQTHDGETKAKEKLAKKNLDGIVLNTPATLGAEDGLFTWIDAEGIDTWGSLDKADCAKRIFIRLESRKGSESRL